MEVGGVFMRHNARIFLGGGASCSNISLDTVPKGDWVGTSGREIFDQVKHRFHSSLQRLFQSFRGSNWIGPPRHTMQPKFERWARHLERGARVRGGGRKGLEESAVQTKGGYQNSFIFAEHDRATRPLWDGIRARGRMPS